MEKLMTINEVVEHVPYTKNWVRLLAKRGEFPAPVRVGRNRVAWRRSDVERWLAERVGRGSGS